MSVPVWTYWEGPLPAWVAAARETIGAHARDHRALDPAGFDALRDRDRDLDLAPLYVAHRADVIRAFLLARYGGLWVDADCIVLCDLDALLASFAPYDFVAYHEREGNVNNAFVYAPPGSATAAAWYARVCEVLRAGAERGWRSLGADAIAHAMAAVDAPRHVLGSELVQPVPWSEPERFFATGGAAEHAARFNGRALCYMLSNQAAGGYAGANPGLAIDAPDTFFRYLLDRAAAPAGRPPSEGSTRVSSSTWHHIPFCVDALLDIAPMRVLDVGIGFGAGGCWCASSATSGKAARTARTGASGSRASRHTRPTSKSTTTSSTTGSTSATPPTCWSACPHRGTSSCWATCWSTSRRRRAAGCSRARSRGPPTCCSTCRWASTGSATRRRTPGTATSPAGTATSCWRTTRSAKPTSPSCGAADYGAFVLSRDDPANLRAKATA